MKRLFQLACILLFALQLLAQQTQTKTASTATGGSGWSNPTNAEVTDAVYAQNTITATNFTTDLALSNYGFSIPGGSTINGISVAIIGHASSAASLDLSNLEAGPATQITKVAGTRVGTAHTDTNLWPTTDTTFTLGSSSDLWGLSWAASDINSSGFGVAVSIENTNATLGRTASVDSIIITVTFTVPPAGSQFFKMFSQTRKARLVLANQRSVSVRQPLIVPTRNRMLPVVTHDVPVLMAKSISHGSYPLMPQPFGVAARDFEVDVRVASASRILQETLGQRGFPVRRRDNKYRPVSIADLDELKRVSDICSFAPV